MDANDVIGMTEELSNWNKWGSEDQLGTLNFITKEHRLKAAQEITEGTTVSCAREIEFFSRSPDTTYQSSRLMLETGLGRENEDHTCNSVNASRRAAKENISMVFHGNTVTHLDCFAHFFWKGRMYNNKPASMVTSQDGALVNSVIPISQTGIVSRGILIDLPYVLNCDWLELGQPFTREHIEIAEKTCNVKIQTGDIVFVRTGYCKRRLIKGATNPSKDGSPGPHPNILPLLKNREVSLFGSDTSNDVNPPLFDLLRNPFHVVSLVAMGLPLIDNCDLELLSSECRRLQKWTFYMNVVPLPLQGSTGSPVNPLAII